jgi:integrase
MPRKSKGPRLYRRKAQAGRPAVWVILDSAAGEVSTGCLEADLVGAEKALADYIARKYKPDWTNKDPASVLIADVLNFYASQVAPKLANPDQAAGHLMNLVAFWDDKTCSAIDDASCAAYTAARMAGKVGRRIVREPTARRDLETLQAALNYAHRQRKLLYPVHMTLPARSLPRERWLTRSEAARLVAGALGIVPIAFDTKTREPVKWGRMHKPAYDVARFILIGFYSATRHDAILNLRWSRNGRGGWFDIENEVLYRRGEGQRETTKRRPPVPIPESPFSHVHRWRRITVHGPVEYAGGLIKKERRGWKRARRLAELGEEVTPHIMRRTCITWMLQRSVPIWEVAGFVGASEKMIRDTYGHHSPEHMPAAKRRFRGRNLVKTIENERTGK